MRRWSILDARARIKPETRFSDASTAAPLTGDRVLESRTNGSRSVRTLAFLAAVYAGLQAYLWIVIPTRNTALIAAGGLVILAVMIGDPLRRRETPATAGLTLAHAAGAARALAPPTLGFVALLVIVNALADGAPDPRWSAFLRRFRNILPWALLQQGLLQVTFNRRLTALYGPGLRAAALNGVAFAGMHLPGPLLTAGTFVFGAFWSRVWQKSPNLWVFVIGHALVSAAAQTLLPAAWTHGFRVGPGWFRWRG
jgi:hypothetical protein